MYMSRTLNKVMLIGNVVKDPELKHTPSGIPIVTFTLVTNDSWKDRNGIVQDHTDWHSIVVWRGLADICAKLVKKGARLYVEGKLRTRNFESKTGGMKRVTEVLIDNMLMLDAKRGDAVIRKEKDTELNAACEEAFDLSRYNSDDTSDYLSMLSDDSEDSIFN